MNSSLRFAIGTCAIALACAAIPVAFAADSPARIPTVTRLVKLFLDEEAKLGDAIRAGNAAAIEQQLADDFELRVGSRAGRPVPRAEFVAALVRTRDGGGEISGVAAHDVGGGTVIVSYQQGAKDGPLFIVDVWRKAGEEWKLAIRYASPAGSPRAAIPGVGPEEPEIPKKY